MNGSVLCFSLVDLKRVREALTLTLWSDSMKLHEPESMRVVNGLNLSLTVAR